jgi:hypothetical protein
MLEHLPAWGILVKFATTIWNTLRSLLPRRGRGHLAFVQRPTYDFWQPGTDRTGAFVQFRANVLVSNVGKGDDAGLIVARVRLRLAGLRHLADWQECHQCVVGDDIVGPIGVGAVLHAGDAATMIIAHIHRCKRLPPAGKRLSFRMLVTDNLTNRHRTRLRLKPIPPPLPAPPPS